MLGVRWGTLGRRTLGPGGVRAPGSCYRCRPRAQPVAVAHLDRHRVQRVGREASVKAQRVQRGVDLASEHV